ncbi:MAG: patatin-like phospholipase family protein [Xanthomonadales bacterium]|nr:patatin-like phospholipase family protein [Xanthomonadales bacterium]ODU93803.1 MAG: hypothetical protein ABT18_07240 [Rhodanobacter sp. SCN 66-43]OJY83234.1 MAG: hypothetical protein BGP23_09395 [Xanthomonadales bacterium 66-474]
MKRWWVLLPCIAALGGCVLTPRRPPPPTLINAAVPAGFPADIRLLTVDRQRFVQELPQWLEGLHRAAGSRKINVLVLSGGGAGAAFGAGALAGLARARARPQFDLVTGVSAGALLAPFAFLGPAWDPQMEKVFEGGDIERLQHSTGRWSTIGRFLFPRSAGGNDSLVELVDRNITDAMIDAVGREAATGRMLVVATTDLDDQETMLWNMGAIAAQGGTAAHDLFRKVLVASASVPGVFPPVLIPVQEGKHAYDEMHVDGSVTTPLFIAPLIAQTVQGNEAEAEGASVYVIVNGQLGMRPRQTPINTVKILEESFSAQLTYKTRDALGLVMALSRRYHMVFHLTDMPVDYPAGSFLDFSRKHMQQLFDYGETCAAENLLWTSPGGTIRRDFYGRADEGSTSTECPASASPELH